MKAGVRTTIALRWTDGGSGRWTLRLAAEARRGRRTLRVSVRLPAGVLLNSVRGAVLAALRSDAEWRDFCNDD